jgi:hypothetical protein
MDSEQDHAVTGLLVCALRISLAVKRKISSSFDHPLTVRMANLE